MRALALAATLLLILSPILTTAQPPSVPRTVPDDAWLDVSVPRPSVGGREPVDGGDGRGVDRVWPMPSGAPVRPIVPVPTPRLIVVTAATPGPQHLEPNGRTTSGRASYYCTPARPICHYRYPVGSMVAAACGKLRSAIGTDWRGRRVTVTYRSRSVSVVLVDWCGSTDKTIDLYGRPFSMLGSLSLGVLPVVVSW